VVEASTRKISGQSRVRSSVWTALILVLPVSDTFAIVIGFALAYQLRFKLGLPFLETPGHSLRFYSTVVFWSVPGWLVIFAAYGLYSCRHLLEGLQEYVRVVHACAIGMMGIVVASFVEPTLWISRGWLLIAWLSATVLVCGLRFAIRRGIHLLREHGYFATPALIVGANAEGQALAEQLVLANTSGLVLVGFVDDNLAEGARVIDGLFNLGPIRSLEGLVERFGIRELIVAPTALSRDSLLEIFRAYSMSRDVELRMSSGLFEILTTGVRVQEIGAIPLISLEKVRITGIDAVLKAILDYLGALVGIIVLSPLFVVLGVLIKLDSPGPVFYRRRVLKRGGKTFDAFKFRTMVVDADETLVNDPEFLARFQEGFKLENDPRVTKVGRFLRKTSLDELPQLVNVLRGQMSLVGPRMISPEEAERYGKWQINLLTVKPGITGPWQVNGRSDLPYSERVRLSMHYIRNYTIWSDLQILIRTVPSVLRRRGAY